jgi:hypothetical protein
MQSNIQNFIDRIKESDDTLSMDTMTTISNLQDIKDKFEATVAAVPNKSDIHTDFHITLNVSEEVFGQLQKFHYGTRISPCAATPYWSFMILDEQLKVEFHSVSLQFYIKQGDAFVPFN